MNCTNCGAAMAFIRRYFHCQHCGSYHFPETVDAEGVRVLGQSADASKCPVCTLAMAQALLDDTHLIDFCARCRGVLLARTAFSTVTQKRRAWATLPPVEPLPLNHEELRRQIACPKCGRRFETYPHSGPGNVVLDGCTVCDVIWLDFGEMRQIVEAPGRDRGSRNIHPVDDEYVRHGPSATHDQDDNARSRETDPLRVLADLLFG